MSNTVLHVDGLDLINHFWNAKGSLDIQKNRLTTIARNI